MKTWRCWSMYVNGRYNVYAREERADDEPGRGRGEEEHLIAEGVSGNEASDLVRGFTPPDPDDHDPSRCYDCNRAG